MKLSIASIIVFAYALVIVAWICTSQANVI